jgi:hypothetical protein
VARAGRRSADHFARRTFSAPSIDHPPGNSARIPFSASKTPQDVGVRHPRYQEAFVLASRIALLKDEQMILLGPPAELLASSHPEARAFADCFLDAQSIGRAT